MTKDKELEKLFSTAITSFDDNAEFCRTLSDNLSKIEYAKKYYDRRRHTYRINVALSFAADVVSAALAFLIYPLLPYDAQIVESLIHCANVVSGQAKIISSILFILLSSAILYSGTSALLDSRRAATESVIGK